MFLARYLVSIGVLRNFFVWEWINNLVGLIGDVKDVNCQLGYLGEQLLTLFIVDIVVSFALLTVGCIRLLFTLVIL